MRVKDIMTVGVRIAEPDEQLPHAAKKMRTQEIGALPVVENKKLIGMVTDRDIVLRSIAENRNPMDMTVAEVMSDECYWCTDTEQVEDAVRIMEKLKVRRLPVMDADHTIVGMLSIEDIAVHAPQWLTGEVFKAVAISKRKKEAN